MIRSLEADEPNVDATVLLLHADANARSPQRWGLVNRGNFELRLLGEEHSAAEHQRR